jgi:hypothetical protein
MSILHPNRRHCAASWPLASIPGTVYSIQCIGNAQKIEIKMLIDHRVSTSEFDVMHASLALAMISVSGAWKE